MFSLFPVGLTSKLLPFKQVCLYRLTTTTTTTPALVRTHPSLIRQPQCKIMLTIARRKQCSDNATQEIFATFFCFALICIEMFRGRSAQIHKMQVIYRQLECASQSDCEQPPTGTHTKSVQDFRIAVKRAAGSESSHPTHASPHRLTQRAGSASRCTPPAIKVCRYHAY